MTTIVQHFTDSEGAPIGGAVSFLPCGMRSLTAGPGMLVPCPIVFQIDPVTGDMAAADLEPGCYEVTITLNCRRCPQPVPRLVIVPTSGEHDLWDLLAASEPLPPTVNTYVVSVGGLSGIVTAADIAAMVGAIASGSYIHTQPTPALVWNVTHNLGQQIVDATTVFSLDYATQYRDVIVECLGPNTCNLYFADPTSGQALIQK